MQNWLSFQLVEEIFNHQDQMARLADRCLKYEAEDGYAGFQVWIHLFGQLGYVNRNCYCFSCFKKHLITNKNFIM